MASSIRAGGGKPPPARIFLDGAFRTPGGVWAEALGVIGDRIVAIGNLDEVERALPGSVEKVGIGGGVAFPGFCDSHIHLLNFGRSRMGASCWPDETPSIASIVAKVRSVDAELPPGKWMRGRGFDPTRTDEARAPTAEELDLPSGRPVVLDSFDFHRRVANHAALTAAGIDDSTPDPPGGVIVRDVMGVVTGELFDAARGLVDRAMPPWDDADDREAFSKTSKHFARAGFTHVINAAPLGMASLGEEVRAFTRAASDDESPIRVSTMIPLGLFEHVRALDIPLGFGNGTVRLNGVKIFSDGAYGPRTACMHEPYADGAPPGHLSVDEDQLAEVVSEISAAGWRACVHAIGDRAVAVAAAAMESAPSASLGHRIEHCCLSSDEVVAGMARGKVVPVPQMPFLRERSSDFSEALGAERMARLYPLRSWIDAGLRPLHSSDAPVVTNVQPMASVHAAITRRDAKGNVWGAEEGIELDEALAMLTTWPADAEGLGDGSGRLAPGYLADMTVLPSDPYQSDVEDLESMLASMTIVGGEVVWNGDS